DQITGEEINFFYEEYSTENSNNITTIFNTSPFYRFEMKYPKNVVNNSCFLPFDNYIDDDAGKYFNRYLAIKRLKKITFRNGSIDFNYNINRDDLSNGKALTSITVKDINHKVVKQVDLEYGYFTSNIQINEFSRRLKLLSIKETGKNKYIFDYYEDDNLPNIGSLYQDFFGYHNQPEVPYNPDNFGTINKKYAKYYFYPNKKEYS